MDQKKEKDAIQPFEKVNVLMKIDRIIINNFIGGLSWALGATIGLALIISILTIIVQNINFNLIPIVGTFISKVIDFVLANNPNLHK